jgi:alkylated DNA repair dioxygenase AlkB
MSQPVLFLSEPSESALPAGFGYWPDAFTAAEERTWLRAIEALPFKPFEFHGYLGKRRIVSFGWRYDYAGRALRESTPMADFLAPLRERAATVAGLDAASLQQALVTEYDSGVTIGWHRDKPMFEDVVALSFLAPCVLRLRRQEGTRWLRQSALIAPRSGYLLHGSVRSEWEYSIVPMDVVRYSVTFRSLRPDYQGPR